MALAPATTDASSIESARADALVRRALAPAAMAGAIIFTLASVTDLLVLPAEIGRPLFLPHAASAAAFLLFRAFVAHRLRPAHAQGAIAAMAGIGTIEASMGLVLAPRVVGSVAFVLLLVGTASVILSRRWMVAVSLAGLGAWTALAFIFPTSEDTAAAGIVLVASAVVAFFVHDLRRSAHAQMVASDLANDRSRAELETSEARWRMLVENAPDVIFTTDLDWRITFINRGPATGPGSAVGSNAFDWIPEHERTHVASAFLRVAETLAPTTYETTGPSAAGNGALAYYKSSVGPVLDGDRLVGLMIIATDITAQHDAEDARVRAIERQQEIKRLKEMDSFKTQFINTAAHELGTPLTPIRMQLHLLKLSERTSADPRAARSIEILDRNVIRLGHLLKDVLDAARLQAGHLGVRREPVELSRLAREAHETFEPTAEAAGVALTMDVPELVSVEGDPGRLTQVLFNLIGNALKFTPSGGRVELSLRRDGEEAVISVRDTGPGIPPERLALLFTPFTRLHEDDPDPKPGTGLGLYITRGIVEQHGGGIAATSEGVGCGTTFTVRIPLLSAVPVAST